MIAQLLPTDGRKCSVQGGRERFVDCEICNGRYSFIITRVAIGEDRTLFSWTDRQAYAKAEADAYQKLATILAMEFDIAPCPHCGWVQLAMVDAMNAKSYVNLKQFSTMAFVGSLVFGGIFLFIAFCTKPFVPVFIDIALVAMALGSGIAYGLSYLRRVLLRRCNPNKQFISKAEAATSR
jgi:hypothetical protein